MSPRQADPQLGTNLIEAAAQLLAEDGPKALSTRRLAAAVGTSTTSVYTHFGGKTDLVRAVVKEGFKLLNRRMAEVGETSDPVADVAALGWAYRENAVTHRHLYSVMFGAAGLGDFSLTADDRQHGRYTLEILVHAVARCMEVGRFQPGDAQSVAHQMWIGLHGLVTLELGGYLIEPYDADVCFEAQVCGMVISAGVSRDEAVIALKRAREQRP